MSAAAAVVVCPTCQKKLRVPDGLSGKKLRCKGCGGVVAVSSGAAVSASALAAPSSAAKQPIDKAPSPAAAKPPSSSAVPAPKSAPAKPAPAKPASADDDLPEALDQDETTRPREKTQAKVRPKRPAARRNFPVKLVMPLVMALVAILGLGAIFWWFQDDLMGVAAQFEGTKPAKSALSEAPLLAQANPRSNPPPSTPSGSAEPSRSRPKPPPKGRPNYRGRIASPYPARALLIGVKNYLFLNPLNPGYNADAKNRDLLGLAGLAKALTEEHGLMPDQVLELSDVATRNNPFAPTKATLEATLDAFLAGARPTDHAIVLFAGYATAKDDQAYLVPFDGDPEKPETLLSAKAALDKLQRCPAGRKLLILELSPLDQEQFPFRALPAPLTAKAAEVFTKPPDGVQVWLSAAPGQTSHQFTSGAFIGSVFLHHLAKKADLRPAENWALVQNEPALKDGSALPLLLLAKSVNEATAKSVADRNKAKQTPQLYGSPGKPAAADGSEAPAPAVVVKIPPVGDQSLAEGILRELPLSANDPQREVKPGQLPPFDPKALAKYAPDHKMDFRSLDELKSRMKDQPLRLIALEAASQLEKKDFKLRMRFRFNPNDAQFKRQLESEQQRPATLAADLADLYEQLKAAGELRKSEKSARWQAHYDYVTARVLAKLIAIQEYNFVLGNNLRKDSPPLKEPNKNNGWALAPQEKLQQTETRAYDKERKKILDRLIKEHPGTPWELLAKRELAIALGLRLQEARVEP